MKTKKFSVMLLAVMALFSAKSMANDKVNYEFETFNGQTVSINDANICLQRSETDVLESKVVPSDAEVIAPGRDFVYAADANYYYVQDATRSLITVARKNMNTETALLDGSFMLSYSAGSFMKQCDANSVTLSFCKDDVQAAGSNFATFKLVDEASCKAYLEKTARANGRSEKDINECDMQGGAGKYYSYQTVSESKESGLKVVNVLYAYPCGNKVVAAEVFRTLSEDEGTEMSIDADFEQMFQSFLFLE